VAIAVHGTIIAHVRRRMSHLLRPETPAMAV
jgi:hypothetical protein